MTKSKAAIKAELMGWHEETDRPNLTQVEGKVLELRQRLSEEMATTVGYLIS